MKQVLHGILMMGPSGMVMVSYVVVYRIITVSQNCMKQYFVPRSSLLMLAVAWRLKIGFSIVEQALEVSIRAMNTNYVW